jgi:hypothetical protein
MLSILSEFTFILEDLRTMYAMKGEGPLRSLVTNSLQVRYPVPYPCNRDNLFRILVRSSTWIINDSHNAEDVDPIGSGTFFVSEDCVFINSSTRIRDWVRIWIRNWVQIETL